jgi:hypothetical protein
MSVEKKKLGLRIFWGWKIFDKVLVPKNYKIIPFIQEIEYSLFAVKSIYSRISESSNELFNINNLKNALINRRSIISSSVICEIILLSIFPIPYYAFVSLYLSAFIEDFFTNLVGLAFVLGTTLGTFTVFMGYAFLFRKIKHKVAFFIKNIKCTY